MLFRKGGVGLNVHVYNVRGGAHSILIFIIIVRVMGNCHE